MKRQNLRYNDLNYKRLSKGSDDEDGEETELFTIKNASKPYKEVATVEKNLQEGDTLQALSIRFHCPIAELKRLNNIHKENEIYARNTIKVPARPFSSAIAGVHESGNTSPDGKLALPIIDSSLLESKLNTYTHNKSHDDLNAVIFNSSIASKGSDSASDEPILHDSPEEELCLIATETIDAPGATPCRMSCNGVDADISWIALIVLVMVVIFAVPVLIVLYMFEHPKEFQHKHGNHSLTSHKSV